MIAELVLADRVLELHDQLLTEESIHDFLQETAQFLGEKPIEMYGPEIRFRWLVSDRIIEMRVDARRSGYELTLRSFDRKLIMDTYEYRSLKQWLPELCPPLHLWSALLGPEPQRGWWWPGFPVVTTWNIFALTIGRLLQQLPTDIALTPPEWRVGLAYLWNIGATPAGFGGVYVSGEPDGLNIDAGAAGVELFIPRTHLDAGLVNVTDVIAGMAPSHVVSGVEHFATEGFDSCPITPKHGEGEFPHPEVPRPGITLDEARAIIATEVPPITPKPKVNGTMPPKVVLTIPQAVDAVTDAVTHARLGMIRVLTFSSHKDLDSRQVVDYMRQLCDALAGRFGFPLGLMASNNHYFMRIFQVGDLGVQVTDNGCVTIGQLHDMLASTYGNP